MKNQESDSNWNHLFPEFRQRLRSLFEEASKKGLVLQMVEGYRSPARQEMLYAQGRPQEPGYQPGSIVTYSRIPKWHGAGLAADCYPEVHGNLTFTFSSAQLQIYRSLMSVHGLRTAGMKGDYGHTQMDADEPTRLKAVQWVRNGFMESSLSNISIEVNGTPVSDADAIFDADAHVSARIRPILDILGAAIVSVTATLVSVEWAGEKVALKAEMRGGHATIEMNELRKMTGIEVQWNSSKKRVIVRNMVV